MIRLAALLMLLAAARAEAAGPGESPAASPARQKPVPAFGDDHPDCPQWTDGCIVCARGAEGPDCSMAGIACLPAEPACLTKNR
ncbi:hypothetical protein [Methylocystis parvus]|uniref:Uncharacterized protein n=1 Tax=Methylocystis parvus TaxID=134 RepID=A0A6B8M5L7_9HYPH|nr:hypothetical protein [Methylocystis parvus]QGM97635.1 hypothetical protein F7D14_09285 [Methylocystis parvus]WBJ98431.1 hypothetical protein MMG94_10310 [Methylocystis parvus OBBP]